MNYYLNVNIEKQRDKKIRLMQPHLTKEIVRDVKINHSNMKSQTPVDSSKIFHRQENNPPHNNDRFRYFSISRKQNFLENITWIDIAYASHQCTHFREDMRAVHRDAILYPRKKFTGTIEEGLLLKPNDSNSFEVYANEKFDGDWNRLTAPYNTSTAKSRTGYVVTFANYPIVW